MPTDRPTDASERARVECLFRIWNALSKPDARLEDVLPVIVQTLSCGMSYPERCGVRAAADGLIRQTEGFTETPLFFSVDISAGARRAGTLCVCYPPDAAVDPREPLSIDERHMVEAVAARLGNFIEMHDLVKAQTAAMQKEPLPRRAEDWRALMALLRGTNLELVFRLSHKMLVHLCLRGVPEANAIIDKLSRPARGGDDDSADDLAPIQRTREETQAFSGSVFELADRTLSDEEIFSCLQRWMHEEKCSYFVRTISNPDSTLRETIDAIRFLGHCADQGVELSDSLLKAAHVHLIQRFLSDRLAFVKVAKDFVSKEDFYQLIRRMVYLQGSHGKLGAKGARLFLASHILLKRGYDDADLKKIKTPKTWSVTTDCLFAFLCYNNLEDLMDQKYKKLDQIREEFPLVQQFFRNAQFPPEMVRGLAMALDDFGEVPLVVRSSSLLEDQLGAEFAGKYACRFIANRGKKSERLRALLDAIAEVYASVFSADPIGFRAERGLIDFEEDVGVLIQEVVGIPVGKYYFPPYAGTVHSGILSEDSPHESVLNLVFGLGTRAKEADGQATTFALNPPYPRLSVTDAGAPGLMDVLNLETSRIETLEIREIMKQYGRRMIGIDHVLSAVKDGSYAPFSPVGFDFDGQPWAVTFEGLIGHTPFARQMRVMLDALTEGFRSPLELELASNGHDTYLLDCRPPKSGRIERTR